MMNQVSFARAQVRLPENGWGMFRKDGRLHAQYILTAPEGAAHQDILLAVIQSLLAGMHMALRAAAPDAESLYALQALDPQARLLKTDRQRVLVAHLEALPSAEVLRALPQGSGVQLRFAGFADTVPFEQIFACMLEDTCPAAVTLDCAYVDGRPALAIRFDHQAMDEAAVVDAVRRAVQAHHGTLCMDLTN